MYKVAAESTTVSVYATRPRNSATACVGTSQPHQRLLLFASARDPPPTSVTSGSAANTGQNACQQTQRYGKVSGMEYWYGIGITTTVTATLFTPGEAHYGVKQREQEGSGSVVN